MKSRDVTKPLLWEVPAPVTFLVQSDGSATCDVTVPNSRCNPCVPLTVAASFPDFQAAIVAGKETDTIYTKNFDGLYARVLRNEHSLKVPNLHSQAPPWVGHIETFLQNGSLLLGQSLATIQSVNHLSSGTSQPLVQIAITTPCSNRHHDPSPTAIITLAVRR